MIKRFYLTLRPEVNPAQPVIAEGVEYTTGTVALELTQASSVTFFPSIKTMLAHYSGIANTHWIDSDDGTVNDPIEQQRREQIQAQRQRAMEAAAAHATEDAVVLDDPVDEAVPTRRRRSRGVPYND